MLVLFWNIMHEERLYARLNRRMTKARFSLDTLSTEPKPVTLLMTGIFIRCAASVAYTLGFAVNASTTSGEFALNSSR